MSNDELVRSIRARMREDHPDNLWAEAKEAMRHFDCIATVLMTGGTIIEGYLDTIAEGWVKLQRESSGNGRDFVWLNMDHIVTWTIREKPE